MVVITSLGCFGFDGLNFGLNCDLWLRLVVWELILFVLYGLFDGVFLLVILDCVGLVCFSCFGLWILMVLMLYWCVYWLFVGTCCNF